MPLLTVLTAAHAGGAEFLPDTGNSVFSQELPDGWEVEWVVQEDGAASTDVRERLPDDERVQYSADEARLGPGITRNLALARARGQYLQNLDVDDMLLPGALTTVIRIFEEHPSVHWAFGQAHDLMPDGSRKSFPPWIPPFGLMPAGRLTDWVIEHDGNWPIPCAGIAYRTASLRAVGGWAALPVGEDIAMMAALSQITDGWQDEAVTWLYRQHPNQLSRHPEQPSWSVIARRFALQRTAAARLSSLSLTGTDIDPQPIAHVGQFMKTPAHLA
ncbi:MAG: glycosyltransferase [Propionibacteriales bacterium]|nr:glycosyltransferase [Propionibacteriales bacterium]